MASEPLPEDFYYDAKTFAREPPAVELPSSFAPLYHSFAFESHKRCNLHYLDEVRAAPDSRKTACNPCCRRAPLRRLDAHGRQQYPAVRALG